MSKTALIIAGLGLPAVVLGLTLSQSNDCVADYAMNAEQTAAIGRLLRDAQRSQGPSAQLPSDWALTPGEIEAGLVAQEARAERQASAREAAASFIAAPSEQSVDTLGQALSDCYAAGAVDAAGALIEEDARAISWEGAPSDLFVSTHFRRHSSGGDVEISLTRATVGEPLVVAFPPGTYGEYVPTPGFRRAQDLALLRAPVVVLHAEQSRATVRVPVACASFSIKGPDADQPYTLRSFESGSAVERLMVALCADELRDEAETQVAVWIARNDIQRDPFLARTSRLVTFQSHQPIRARHVRGAAQLLLEGGIDPRGVRFFEDHYELDFGQPEDAAPAQEAAPVEEAPVPQAAPELSPVGDLS